MAAHLDPVTYALVTSIEVAEAVGVAVYDEVRTALRVPVATPVRI